MMDETLLRLVIVLGAVMLVLSVVLISRSRDSRPRLRVVRPSGLSPGLYFFSSEDCETCQMARQALEDALGTEGYVEMAWEREAEEFTRLGVEEVPATMVVNQDGMGILYPGQPQQALDSFSP